MKNYKNSGSNNSAIIREVHEALKYLTNVYKPRWEHFPWVNSKQTRRWKQLQSALIKQETCFPGWRHLMRHVHPLTGMESERAVHTINIFRAHSPSLISSLRTSHPVLIKFNCSRICSYEFSKSFFIYYPSQDLPRSLGGFWVKQGSSTRWRLVAWINTIDLLFALLFKFPTFFLNVQILFA